MSVPRRMAPQPTSRELAAASAGRMVTATAVMAMVRAATGAAVARDRRPTDLPRIGGAVDPPIRPMRQVPDRGVRSRRSGRSRWASTSGAGGSGAGCRPTRERWWNGPCGSPREDRFRALRTDQEEADARAGRPTGAPPTVTLADGLVAVAEASLAAGAAAHPGSERYRIHVFVDASPTEDDPYGVASIGLGPPLPAALRSLLLCDCSLRPVFEVHGAAVSIGRVSRTIPERLRRVVEHRDGGCRVPGCGRTWGIEVHHIWHWEDDGPTDTDNLLCLCKAHHRQHHLKLLGIAGNADRRRAPRAWRAHADSRFAA